MTPGPAPAATRLALFLPSLEAGGTERMMLNVADGLARAGHAVDVVVANAKGPYRALLSSEVGLVDLGVPRVMHALPGLIGYLRRTRPAALLSALDHANAVALLARRLARVRAHVYPSFRTTPSALKAFENHRTTVVAQRVLQRLQHVAAGFVAVSDGVADDVARELGLPRGRITTIYNPVITPSMLRQAQEPVSHPWFQPGSPPVVLSAGRLVPLKDHALLLKALARLAAQGSDARLVILGEGPERPHLESLAASLGIAQRVLLPGFTLNPYAWMRQAQVFALSSRVEGMPTALVEALACGAAVVSTDCPSGPRELLRDGRAGLLVPVGKVPAMTEALALQLSPSALRPSPETLTPFHYAHAIARYRTLLTQRAP